MNSGLFSLLESPTIGSMKKYALITFLTLVSLAPLTATAQTIDVLRQFIYGDLTIVDNDAPRDLIIAPNGDITANPSHIVVLSDVTPPVFDYKASPATQQLPLALRQQMSFMMV